MKRWLKIAVVVVGTGVAALALLFALAWILMPRDWIEREAKRQASRMSGVAIHWNRLAPSLEGLAIGVRLEGLTVRAPATGDPAMDARVNEVFFRMKLLPLLFRRVEVSAARVRNAWVTMLD
ncbi:MAG: hypothetical protein HY568_02340, partial [Candidatus Latescibacteria bacterium]|nr:hypothetical protein [Candidatus Latescibacterota bacterium]